MQWSKWYLIKEKNTGGMAIKRYAKVAGKTKWERYPAQEYKSLSATEVEALVRRLNASRESEEKLAIDRYNYDHAFINVAALKRYDEYIQSCASNKDWIDSQAYTLRKYVLEFFVNEQKLADPKTWPRVDDKWGLWLLKKKFSRSHTRSIIANANRFLDFLHVKVYPGELALIKLRPLTKKKLLTATAQPQDRYKYISPKDFQLVIAVCQKHFPEIIPAVKLCYYFGLRASESLGLKLADVRQTYLSVERQQIACSNKRRKYGPLKDLDVRRVPYWYATAAQAYEWISQLPYIHQKGYINGFNQLMASGLGFQTHDLRRSFVTIALGDHNWRDVKNAVGHSDVSTTMKYDQSGTRQHEDQVWQP